jgi:DNA invertase Pin-like site-specific DNA recombinase
MSAPQMPTAVVAYHRVSTDKQKRSGLGLEAQQAATDAYAASIGARVVASYVETESGRKDARPQLARALAHARRVRGVLAIAKLDRLARSVAFIANLMDVPDVEFVCCDQPHATRLTLHIMAAIAEDEAQRIGQRTRDALAALKERGQLLGRNRHGVVGANLTAAGSQRGAARSAEVHRAAARAAYADLTPFMRELRDGGRSFGDVARALNGRGERTRTGCAWSGSQVHRVLARAAAG